MAFSDRAFTILKDQGWSVAEYAYRRGRQLIWQVEVSKGQHVVLARAFSQQEAWPPAAEQVFAVMRDELADKWDQANQLLASDDTREPGALLEWLDEIEYEIGMLAFAERDLTG